MTGATGLITGVLLHGIYLGGVFWAVKHGLPAGIAALVVGLQPLATAMLVGLTLGERVSPLRWLGIAVGFAGALLVILPRLGIEAGLPPLQVLIVLTAMLSITLGTIWQKRTGGTQDVRTNTVVHFIGAALVTIPAALLLEENVVPVHAEVLFGLFLVGRGDVDRRCLPAPGPDPPGRCGWCRRVALPGAALLRTDGLAVLRGIARSGADRGYGARGFRCGAREPRPRLRRDHPGRGHPKRDQGRCLPRPSLWL